MAISDDVVERVRIDIVRHAATDEVTPGRTDVAQSGLGNPVECRHHCFDTFTVEALEVFHMPFEVIVQHEFGEHDLPVVVGVGVGNLLGEDEFAHQLVVCHEEPQAGTRGEHFGE